MPLVDLHSAAAEMTMKPVESWTISLSGSTRSDHIERLAELASQVYLLLPISLGGRRARFISQLERGSHLQPECKKSTEEGQRFVSRLPGGGLKSPIREAPEIFRTPGQRHLGAAELQLFSGTSAEKRERER